MTENADLPDYCGHPDVDNNCTEDNCPYRYKFRYDIWVRMCKYRNRDYGPL